ncbi:hypothetical protein JCM3765_002972 [Sporobolomyces pararoseus]
MSRSNAPRRASGSAASTRSGANTTSHEFRPSPLDAILAEQGLHRYRLEPPSWRAPWDGNEGEENGLGVSEGKVRGKGKAWPVFYPTRDGMDEDQMTELAVKSGYSAKLPIAADTFSAHGHILDNLKAKGMLENLSRIVTAVQQKRESNLPTYGSWTFRLPSRITLTDSKREAWFSDLANPAVPLSKLSRSVPHGYKGEKGLDMLAARKVEVGRAIWFVRAFGGVEIQSLAKSRPLPVAISQYTSEFTSVVCDFIRKQLLGLSLPDTESSSRVINVHSRTRTTSAGLSASTSGPKSDFNDPEARTAWKDKFDYTLALLDSLQSGSLLSTPQFLRFLVSIIDPASTTLPQLSLALLLVEEYWDELLEDEPSTARFARTCLIRLEQVEQASLTSSSPLYATLENTLRSLIRSAFLALPGAFVSLFPIPVFPSTSLASSPVPLLPPQISEKLENVLVEPKSGFVTADDIEQDPAVLAMIRADLSDLSHRRQETSRISIPRTRSSASQIDPTASASYAAESRERAQLDLITRLDNFAFPQSIASLHSQIFLPQTNQTPSLAASSTSPNPSLVSPSLQTTANPTSSDPPRARTRNRGPILQLEDALPILFTWCTTPCRLPGSHRRSTVANLIALELEREGQAEEKDRGRQGARTRSSRGSTSTSKGPQGVAEVFVKWVDERYGLEKDHRSGGTDSSLSKTKKQVGNRSDVRGLAEELMRVGALRYGYYMQKMIARGETERLVNPEGEGRESIHLWILRTASVEDSTTGGRQPTRGKKDSFEDTEKNRGQLSFVQEELKRMIPGWSGGEGGGQGFSNECLDSRSLLDAVSELTERGERLSVTREIVSTGLSNLFSSSGSQAANFSPESFALLVHVFDRSRDPVGLLQLLVILSRQTPSPALLFEIVDLASNRIELWSALGGLPELADSLASNLESSKGSSNRRLLACLRPLALAGYLKGPKTDVILNASQVLVTNVPVLVTTSAQPLASSPLVELQTLTVDSSPAAVSQLASTLNSRYGGSSNESWLGLVIDSSVQLLPQLPSIEPIVELFKDLDERLKGGLESPLIRWMRSKAPQHLVSILGGPQGTQLVALLSELVVEGVLPLPVLVNDGFLPTWRSILVLVLPTLAKHSSEKESDPLLLESTLTRTLVVLTEALAKAVSIPSTNLSTDHPLPSPLSPVALLLQQRKSVRLGCLFTSASLPTVSSLLALLVLQQEVFSAADLDENAQAASSLFLRIVSLQQFQSLVVKMPHLVRVGMLESDFVKSLPCFDTFKPKLLAGLLVALKDGGDATPANLISTEDWDLFLSGLTMWRLAVSKVEVEACLERLELDSTLTQEEKNEALHTLSNHFLERVCAGAGQTYLGEQVVKCYHGAASDELVSVAFDRLASAVTNLSTESETLESQESATTAARCTIRLLETLLQSGVASARVSSVRHVLQAINLALQGFCDANPDDSLGRIPLFLNILDIAIRCTDGPSDKATADLFAECLSTCAILAVSLSGNQNEDDTVSTVLLDTCSRLLLALPDLSPTCRLPSIQSLVHSSPSSLDEQAPLTNPSLPDATFARLAHLFGSYTPSSSVPNPWELLDHSEPSPVILGSASTCLHTSVSHRPSLTPQSAVAGYRSAFTNGGPIDLAAFRAKVIETVPAVTALDALSTTSSSSTSSVRPPSLASSQDPRGKQTNFDFETPCTGLSVHARDHRRTSSAARMLVQKFDQAANGNAQIAGGNIVAGRKRVNTGETVPSKVAGPQSGTMAGAEAGGGGGNASSSSQTGSTSSAAPSTRGTKRKATNPTTSNTEVIVIDDEEEEVQPAKPAKKGKTATKTVTSKGKKKK